MNKLEIWKNKDNENLEGELWKDVKDWEGLYQVSNYGRVKSLIFRAGSRYHPKDYPIILTQRLCDKGYCMVSFRDNERKSTKRVHILVGKAFIPNPNNLPQINHCKGIKVFNCVEDLEWSSNIDNMRHSYKIGLRDTSSRGEMNGRSKVSEEEVVYIYTNPDRKTISEITKQFNLGKTTVNSIYSGKNWSYLTKDLKCNKVRAYNVQNQKETNTSPSA